MKNYYLYLDPDDGILYVQKDGEIIAPVKTSASLDPKTIRIKDGYLQIRDFETNNWKFICDENGQPVSLKGPAGDQAVLDLIKDSFSVLIGNDSETDGNQQFTTYLNYYLNSNQEIIDCEENIEVECSDKITVYLHNDSPYKVKITIVIPASTPLTDIENDIKLKTVGLPFACASIHLLPDHLPKESWEIMECPSVIKVEDDVPTSETFTVITGPTNSSLPPGYVLQAIQGESYLTYTKGNSDKEYIFTIDSTNTLDDIVVTLSQSGTEISKRVIQFLHESKYKPIDPEVIDSLQHEVSENTEKLNDLIGNRLTRYQVRVDNDLLTSDHTIVGAINELYQNQLVGGTTIKGSYIQGSTQLIYRDLNLQPGQYTITGDVMCTDPANDPYTSACIYVAKVAPKNSTEITNDSTVYELGADVIVADEHKVYLVFASEDYMNSLREGFSDQFEGAQADCTITVSNLKIQQVVSTMGLRGTTVNYIPVPIESVNYINANTVLTKKALLARQEFSQDYVQLEQGLDQESLKELYKEILLNPNKNIAPGCQFIKIENVDGVLNLPTLQELYDNGVNSSSLDSFYRYISENNRAYIYITDMDYITTEAQWITA